MPVISRDRVQVVHEGSIIPGPDIKQSPIIPAGETWMISRIIFADGGIGDGISGAFRVDYGTTDILLAAYLTGNTMAIEINREFTGDGAKRFRFIRVNHSAEDRSMVIIVEGRKKIGGVS